MTNYNRLTIAGDSFVWNRALFVDRVADALPGLTVSAFGKLGSNISTWSESPENLQPIIDAVPDVVLFFDGTNSKSAGMNGATWAYFAKRLIARLRAQGDPKIILAVPPENMIEPTGIMAQYQDAAQALTEESGIQCVNIQGEFGDPSNPAAYADLYLPDRKHLKLEAGDRIAAACLRVLSTSPDIGR